MSASNIKLLENFIDFCSLRNKLISENIANIGTENYKRKDVRFSDILSDNINNLKTTNDRQLKGAIPEDNAKIYEDQSKDMASGINNVDIDQEMAELAKNTIRFKFASQQIGNYYKTLQEIIQGGNGGGG